MTLDASLEGSLANSSADQGELSSSIKSRHPDSWAAYGRFIYASVRTGCSQQVKAIDEGLRQFRRPVWKHDASLVYAYQDCDSPADSILTTATRALRSISTRDRVDHLNVYVTGSLPPEDQEQRTLYSALDGAYIAVAFPYKTHDVLEFPPTFEEFLRSLGHSNRRHMKARQEAARQAGITFAVSSDLSIVCPEERYLLGLLSRPTIYSRETIDAWNGYALSQSRFFHCMLRSPEGKLLSYCIGFIERNTAVMMYQLNHEDYPQLGLSMTLRGFLIQHLTGLGVRRLVLPMGVAGHLKHAATVNTVAQVLFVRRSLSALAKALLLRLTIPTSHAALMVGTEGFAARMILGDIWEAQPIVSVDSLNQ